MITIMMRHFLLFNIIATSSGLIINTPSYITFNTEYYNATDCNRTAYHNTSYDTICFSSVENCCNKLLSETSYLPNRDLDVCYTEIVNNNTISFLYDCEETTLSKDQSILVSFSIVGIVYIFLTLIMTITFCCWCCFCRGKRHGNYGVIN